MITLVKIVAATSENAVAWGLSAGWVVQGLCE